MFVSCAGLITVPYSSSSNTFFSRNIFHNTTHFALLSENVLAFAVAFLTLS